jgi:predicted nucleotidyltransferase component of viral defense system
MISPQELRKFAREKGLALDLVEKDYVLGWILFGIASSGISSHLAFKGGTALAKVYFPDKWRLSEDLDFTLLNEKNPGDLATTLSDEVPSIVEEASSISMVLRKPPFTNPHYLQSKFQYIGPVSKNTVKIEITTEGVLGGVIQKVVPRKFDYSRFSVRVYTLENILSEKIRTLLQRGKAKDYYDVWKLLKTKKFDGPKLKRLFLKKCEAKDVAFKGVDQFFPHDLVNTLKPHVKMGLARLSREPLPPIDAMIEELRTSLTALLSQDSGS